MFYFYRSNVAALIDRVKKVSVAGADVDFDSPTRAQQADAAVPQTTWTDDEVDMFVQERIEEVEARVAADLDGALEAIRGLTDRAIRAEIELDLERTYRIVWGSQVRALRLLASRDAQVGSREDVEAVYASAVAMWPKFFERIPFEQWMRFLLAETHYEGASLVAAELGGGYRITEVGEVFLAYIDHRAYPEPLF